MTRLALLLAVLSALALAFKARSHRPIAGALALLLAIDVARLATAGGEGWAWRLDAGLTAAWYAVTAAAVVDALRGRWMVNEWLFAWGSATWLACAVKAKGGDVADVWRGLFGGCLLFQAAVASRFAVNARRRPWSPGEVVALLLAASSVADLAGPWLRAHPVLEWSVSLLPSTATWLTIAMYQVTLCLPIRLRSSR